MSKRALVYLSCACLAMGTALFGASPGACQCAPPQPASLDQSYIGIYADENHAGCNAFQQSNLPERITFWIWLLPERYGIDAAEFKISYPSNVETPFVEHQNPEIQLSLGNLAEGVAFTFESCQTDWVWTHYQSFYLTDCMPSEIQVVGYPGTGTIDYSDCQFMIKEFRVLNYLYLNNWCDLCIHAPYMVCASAEGPATVQATFLGCIDASRAPFEDNFILYDKSNPADSIGVVEAVLEGSDFTLTLERTMVSGTTYILKARQIWNCDYMRADSQREIYYESPNATMVQSYSATLGDRCVELAWRLSQADEGISFVISRSEDGGAFAELDGFGVRREGLGFAYTDSKIEPERRYAYRVDCVLDGTRTLLFESDPVETPAARLVLDQNRPNPFNPSTTISFDLPSELAVSLEVYDISGRLVSRLIGGEMLGPGPHSIQWNGTDDRGTTVSSGVYIYRLLAGKSIVSRKMVMLR
jgi:hypothetical protein